MHTRPVDIKGRRGWVLLAGGSFAIGGLALGTLVLSYLPVAVFLLPEEFHSVIGELIILLFVGMASFVSGAIVWWSLVESTYTANSIRGSVVGAITVVLSQLLVLLPVGFLVYFPRTSEFDLVHVPQIIAGVIGYALIFSFYSLLFFGILLFPVGMAIGFLLGRFRKSNIEEPAARGHR